MSGLQIDPSIQFQDACAAFDCVPTRVQQQLASKGLITGDAAPPFVKDQRTGQEVPYNGWLPPDLTQLSDEHLGWYLGMLSGWSDYVERQLAEAFGAMTVAKAKLEFVNAHLLMIHKKEGEKKRPEPERKALVLIDRRYVEAQAGTIYHETYYRHVKAIANTASQNYSAVSRRISQRQQDIERQKRTVSVGNIGGALFRQP